MSIAYNMEQPNGLSNYNNFTRWRIIGGPDPYWTPYANDKTYIDQLALNGLYYIATNDFNTAMTKWKGIISIANPTWNSANQEYEYPGVDSNYYLGLFAIFTNFLRLMDTDPSGQQQLLQHAISIRSSILWNQIVNSSTGVYCSWCTNIPNGGSVMNAETTAANALGLGAGSLQTFEVGLPPMEMQTASYFQRPYHALSAVVGLSSPGYMSYGPFLTYPEGSYQVEFILRSPSPSGIMVTLDITYNMGQGLLASQNITGGQFPTSNDWTSFIVPFNIPSASYTQIEFRIFWHGTANMDACIIRMWGN